MKDPDFLQIMLETERITARANCLSLVALVLSSISIVATLFF